MVWILLLKLVDFISELKATSGTRNGYYRGV